MELSGHNITPVRIEVSLICNMELFFYVYNAYIFVSTK